MDRPIAHQRGIPRRTQYASPYPAVAQLENVAFFGNFSVLGREKEKKEKKEKKKRKKKEKKRKRKREGKEREKSLVDTSCGRPSRRRHNNYTTITNTITTKF